MAFNAEDPKISDAMKTGHLVLEVAGLAFPATRSRGL